MVDDVTLWAIRREFGIADDDKGGWKKLTAALVDKFKPTVDDRQFLALLLMGLPNGKKYREPKKKWTPMDMSCLLFVIDDKKKSSSNRNETDASIVERRLAVMCKNLGITQKSLINRVSTARKQFKTGKLPTCDLYKSQ